MARAVTTRRTIIATAGAWLAGFLIFFPILWMVLASFKTELEAFAVPPSFLFFHWRQFRERHIVEHRCGIPAQIFFRRAERSHGAGY